MILRISNETLAPGSESDSSVKRSRPWPFTLGALRAKVAPRISLNVWGRNMNSSMAYVNGADAPDLAMIDALRAASAGGEQPALDKSKSKDEHQAEKESQEETISKPGGYDNDPDDATNPNEVRERHLKKLKP